MKRIFMVEHASERALTRQVSDAEIRSVIETPDRRVRTRKKRMKAEKDIDGQTLRVIYEERSEKYVVVTVVWL